MCHATVCIDNNDNDNLNRNSDNNSNNIIETGSGLRFDEKSAALRERREIPHADGSTHANELVSGGL